MYPSQNPSFLILFEMYSLCSWQFIVNIVVSLVVFVVVFIVVVVIILKTNSLGLYIKIGTIYQNSLKLLLRATLCLFLRPRLHIKQCRSHLNQSRHSY